MARPNKSTAAAPLEIVEPIGTRVLIRKDDDKKQTKSGLHLPDKVEIPTLRGRVEMSVPAGTQSGKVFRLRGQGLPHLEGRGRGDQLVRVFCEVPTKLTDRQKELLEEFANIEGERSGKRSFFDRVVDYFS